MPTAPFERLVEAILGTRPAVLPGLLRDDPELVRWRVEKDILVEAVPHWLYVGDTLLHLASAAVRLDAAKALIAAGADVNAANRRGARPLHYACDPRPAYAQGWNTPAQEELIRCLVTSGADVDAADKSGVRALHRAVRSRSPAAVRALLSAGANPTARAGRNGSTPLELTANTTGAAGVAGAAAPRKDIENLLRNAGAR